MLPYAWAGDYPNRSHIPFDRIEQSHLQALIEAKAAESRYIDYKSATYGNNDSARAEFLADISSFANALGGDLVIGMRPPTAFLPIWCRSLGIRIKKSCGWKV
jgi:hypothetical protein